MPFVPFPRVAKVELIYRQDGQITENVLHYRALATFGIAAMESLAAQVVFQWNVSLKPLTHSSTSLIAVRVTDLQSISSPVLEYVTGLPIVGTQAGIALPNNVTVVAKLITNARGRSFRGRVYQVGLSGNSITGNVLVSSYRTSLRAAWVLMQSMGGEEDWTLVVASRISNGVPRGEGVATTVTDVSVNPTLDSQRRRLPERGL
jgi:hypothetical protein